MRHITLAIEQTHPGLPGRCYLGEADASEICIELLELP